METGVEVSLDPHISENELRMLEYGKKEQDFLQYINHIRRERDTAVTPDQPAPRLLHPKGIQCLLALTKLLEETVKLKQAEINSIKDSEDLNELRRQAERMSLTDHKNFHFDSPTVEGGNNSDDPSFIEDYRSSRLQIDQDHNDNHKTKSLRVGTQMLSGTLGRVKTKFLKTSASSKESPTIESKKYPAVTPNSGSSAFGQRKNKHYEYGQSPHGVAGLVHSSSNELLPTVGSGGLSSLNGFQRTSYNRYMSEAPKTNQPGNDDEYLERFASLPDNLERMIEVSVEPLTDINEVTPRKIVVSHDKAPTSTRSQPASTNSRGLQTPTITNTIPEESDSSSHVSVKKDSDQTDLEAVRNSMHLSKDFAKKLEKWVSKSKPDNKDNQSKQSTNQSRPKGGKKKGKTFNRQRSMSADRAGLLAGRNDAEFEEKLRQWGIKQACDPGYYLEGRQSRNSERSVESPARLISQEDNSPPSTKPLQSPDKLTPEIKTSQPATRLHRPVSIERGRRVSPHRVKRYTSRTSQASPKESCDGTSSSSSGSLEPINHVLPSDQQLGSREARHRTASIESFLSTDESVTLEEEAPSKAKGKRPLSLVAMTGSLESAEPRSPAVLTSQQSFDSEISPTCDSKELLKTINEDISKIREKKAQKSDSSSETSLDRFSHEGSTSKIVSSISPKMQKLNFTVEELPGTLPSHSVCVDSGLAMEEDSFIDPLLHLHHSLQAQDVLENKESREDELLKGILNQNSSLGDPFVEPQLSVPHLSPGFKAESALVSPKSSHSTPEPSLSHKHPDGLNSKFQYSPKPAEKAALFVKPEITISTEPLFSNQNEFVNKLMNTNPDAPSEELLVKAKLIKIDSHPDTKKVFKNRSHSESVPLKFAGENNKVIDQPLEPLLSSQSVPLRTKLDRLSCLYDHDDGTDLKIKMAEPSGPYDVFKAPKKHQHPRSRSLGGMLDSDISLEELRIKPGSSSEEMDSHKAGYKSDRSSKVSPRSHQGSPVALRAKGRINRPVLDLVQKFDAQSSDSSSPLVSPTAIPVSSSPQMVKITERLLQSKANKTHRYTVDLTRHVKEIPREGAVQRARTIFMDMQST